MVLKVRKVNMGSKYYGMNYYANKELKAGYKCHKDEVLVDKKLKGRMLKRTIAHERMEAYHMKRGLKYRKADNIARKFELKIK